MPQNQEKIPWPANIYILLENSRMGNFKMSMVSVKKQNKILDCWNILIHEEIFKKLFWSMPTHMPAPKHLSDEIISHRSSQPHEIEKNSDISAHYITLKKCIRQWITFPYVFRNVHMQTHINVCTYAECNNTQFLCIVCFSLNLSSTVSRRATKAGKQSFLQLVCSLTPSWRGAETGGTLSSKAQKQLLCSQETQTCWFRSWDSELLPLYNL